ncbi:DsbA family protein [Qipengyuania sp.]|uniref:DsbA family protein n=1 Tax=Qipengyuania sp. TaxID=2004515 RepID=UPI0035C80943
MTISFRLAAPLATLGALLALSASAAPAKPKQAVAVPAGPTFAAMVEENDQGHVLGNPEASAKLVEYMSYTCSHCADFARTGDAAIRGFYLPRGKVSYEIRHLLRDPIDLTAALLTHCGAPAKFIGNHEALLKQQDDWLERARKSTQAQRTRWSFGTNGARFRAIASDLGFYAIMEDRGYTRPELDRCLADESKANAMAETSQRDIATFKLQGTPSFLLDGELLDGVYSWEALAPLLDKVG